MALSSKWFYTHNGKDKPRVSTPELLELIHTGTITEKTYVWHKSHCKQWTPVHQVPFIMEQMEPTRNSNRSNSANRMQPSIIRSTNSSSNSKRISIPSPQPQSQPPPQPPLPTLPNLPILKTMSASNTSNNTSSEIQENVANESFGAISESEEDHQPPVEKTITSIAPHIIDEQRMHRVSKPKNSSKVQGYGAGASVSHSFNHSTNSVSYYTSSNSNINANDENYPHNTHNTTHFEYRSQRKSAGELSSKYRMAQLVEINDPQKFRGIVYGLIAEIRHKKMAIKYNNKAFGREWFDIEDERVSVVTDPLKKQQHGMQDSISSEEDAKTDKMSSRVVLPSNNYTFSKPKSKKRHSHSHARHKSSYRMHHKEGVRNRERNTKAHSLLHNPSDLIMCRRKSTILNTVNMNEEKLSLLSERKLLNLEREELQRDHEKFFYCKKKHETEVWAVKNDYIEQTKKLKKQYAVYKKTCDDLLNSMNNHRNSDPNANHLLLKYHKLETKEKLIKDSQKAVDKKQKTAQILYQTSTHLLQKVQDATLKMEVYSKLCDEKCDNERELIKKQEMDRKKYLHKLNKLRDEMLSAPWLLLSSDIHSHKHPTKHDMDKLYTKLAKTYTAIRDERRKFLPVQRKWAKLIMKHQIYAQDEKAFMNVRSKLENIRSYEKEYKLSVFEEIKSMFDGSNSKLEVQALHLKETQILLGYKALLMEDKERQIRNEKKLLRLQQRNLEESIMELEYERELIAAQKSTLHSRINKERLDDISSQISTEGPYPGQEPSKYTPRHDSMELEQKYQQLKEKLESKSNELNETNHKLQEAMHRNDKLQIQLTHFEESMKKEHNDKEAKQQSYEKFTKAMETLTGQFEQMMGIKDDEMKKMDKMLEEWKSKAMELQTSNERIAREKTGIQDMMEQLKQQNKELIAANEQLGYTVPQLTLENEHLREQIQEMIISSDEAIKSHREIKAKTPQPKEDHYSSEELTLQHRNQEMKEEEEEEEAEDPIQEALYHEEDEEEEEEAVFVDDILERLKTPTITVAHKDTKQNTKKEKHKEKKKRNSKSNDNGHLLAIDDETENIPSDGSNYEETAAALSSIRSKLANSDEKGRLISKHESQHSMTAIVDLVKKAKSNMEAQRHDLEILADKPSSVEESDRREDELYHMSLLTQSADDSFSDHVELIENMLKDRSAAASGKDSKRHHKKNGKKTKRKPNKKKNKNKNKKKKKTRLKHSDSPDPMKALKEDTKIKINAKQTTTEDDIRNTYLATPDSNDSNDSIEHSITDSPNDSSGSNMSSSDEPPMFWNDSEIQNDRSILQRMITNPDQILDDVMSPKVTGMPDPFARDELSSDWEDELNVSKLVKKTKKAKKKPRHKRGKKSVDGKKYRRKKIKHKRNMTMQ